MVARPSRSQASPKADRGSASPHSSGRVKGRTYCIVDPTELNFSLAQRLLIQCCPALGSQTMLEAVAIGDDRAT